MRAMAEAAPAPRRRVYGKPVRRSGTAFASDRLARKLAALCFVASVFVALLAAIVSLAVEDSSQRRETERATRDAMAIAANAIAPAVSAGDDQLVRRIVSALARSEGIAWARLEKRAADGDIELIEAGMPDLPAIAEIEARLSADATLVVGIDRARVDERLKRGLLRQLATNLFVVLAGVAAVFVVFQSSVTRHVERVASALERESRSISVHDEPIVLDRADAARGKSPDTLDRLVIAANALMTQSWRRASELTAAADGLERQVAERTASADHERARFQDLVMSSSDWIFETDARGRFVFSSSPKTVELAEWLEGNIANLALCEDADAAQRKALAELQACFARLEPIRNRAVRVRGPDGLEMWMVFNATPVHATAAAGAPVGLRGCIADMSELYAARGRAMRGERMAELGQIVAGVAHEINTPAGSALLFASTIAQVVEVARAAAAKDGTMKLDAQTAEDIVLAAEGVQRNLERVAKLVASFKQVGVDQASEQRRRFDLAEYLGEVSLALSAEWKKRAGRLLEIDVPAGIVMDSFPGCRRAGRLQSRHERPRACVRRPPARNRHHALRGTPSREPAGVDPSRLRRRRQRPVGGNAAAHLRTLLHHKARLGRCRARPFDRPFARDRDTRRRTRRIERTRARLPHRDAPSPRSAGHRHRRGRWRMNQTLAVPATPKRRGVRAFIAHISLSYRSRRETKQLHPIQLAEQDVKALDLLASGAYVADQTLSLVRLQKPGTENSVDVSVTTVFELQKLKFIKKNLAGHLVITDLGRVAAQEAKDPKSRLRVGGSVDAAELVRRELHVRVARHEKWIAGGMNGKRLVVSFADLEEALLEKRNLRQIRLEGCILREAHLANADLSGAELQGCDFSNADLRGTRLRAADLRGCDFTGARLDGADLSGARLDTISPETLAGLRHAYARAVQLGKAEPSEDALPETLTARFDGARLAGCDFRGADLAQASFRHANLTGADLRDAKLAAVDFAFADLAGARLVGARLREADLALAAGVGDHAAAAAAGANIGHRPEPARLADIIERNRVWFDANGAGQGARATLGGMNLSDMDLRGAALAGADLRNANLSGADFRGANLVCADLRGANMLRTLLDGADLRSATRDPPAPAA